ncbi:hypothetical protein E4T47_03022 [Aureobasidium subglaciale]|nr:hypothetical protein E4T47_03022 [Aureobasidium subglaciale]
MSETQYLILSRNTPPAEDGIKMALRGHRNTFALLLAKIKQPLYTKTLYLASAMGRVTCALRASRKTSRILRKAMIKGTLSSNATATLKRGERQALEAIKVLEMTIKPFRRDYPRDVHIMVEAVAFELERRCIDSWLIIEFSKLAEGACVEYAPIRDKLLERESMMTSIQCAAQVRETAIHETVTQISHEVPDQWLLTLDEYEVTEPFEGNPDHGFQTMSEQKALSITSDYLIGGISTPVSDRDIAMLVFH